MKRLKRGQKGFTLVELLLVIAITGLIMGGLTTAILQVLDMSHRTTNRMTAVRQVQQAGFWLSPDAQMAQEIDTESEFLKLTWTGLETAEEHEIIYALGDMPSGELKILWRQHYVDSELDSTVKVAEYIDPDHTSCEWDGNMLTFTVTATVGRQIETKIYEVKPRPSSQ